MGESPRQRQTTLGYARSMPDPHLLDELLQRLRQPAVRDQAWVLLSPALLSDTQLPLRHPLAASPWAHTPGLLADWLLALEDDPAPLLQDLAQLRNPRLGAYYERLWQFALRQAPGIRLLAANLAIREGGHTLGELDLLLEDANGIQHLELAVKFYLGPARGDSRDPASWLGPGREDRLDLKLEHLRRHQLPLSTRQQARPALRELGVERLQAGFWLGGYLFHPWPAEGPPPNGANPQHARGRWLTRQQWPAYRAALAEYVWQPLARHAWLAPACLETTECWQPEQFDAWLAHWPANAPPPLLAGLQQQADGSWHERERLFLVETQWPQGAARDSTTAFGAPA